MKKNYVILLLACLFSLPSVQATELNQKLSGTATMGAGETDITVTLPLSVDMSRSVLFFTLRVDDADVGQVLVGGELSSSNTIDFHRNAGGPTVNISYQVLEFTLGVSVQRGVANNVGPTTGITLPTAVDLTRSFALVSYENNGGTFGTDDGLAADLTTTTNLNLVSNGGGIENAYWQVVECTDCDVQKVSSTLTGTSVASTFTAVNQSKTLLFTSQHFAGNIQGDDLPRTEFTANNEITHNRTGNGPDVELITYVVEFTDATTTVQHGSLNFPAGDATETATLSTTINTLGSVVLSSGASGYQGSGGITTADNPGANWYTMEIDNGNTISARRAATGGTLGTLPYQVAEFNIVPPQVWYVFVNGDWSDPNTWTLDASTAPIFNNPSNEIPNAGDQVIIYSGKEVTTDVDNIEVNFIQVDGELDLANSTGHDFSSINGSGFIRTAGHDPGTGLVDNFPAGTTNASIGFGDAANGGTLIVEGSGDLTFTNEFTSGNSRPFRNIRVDRNLATDKLIIGADLELTGNLDIRNGDVQINDDTNTTPLLIEIREDVELTANASMSVSTADAFTNLEGGAYGDYHRSYHTITVGGNFNNRGEVRFTNQTTPNYTDRTTSGAVSLVFNRAKNTVLNAQGITDLYNLVIDKGVDQTYELEVNATQRNFFSLFGRVDLGNNGGGGNAAHPEQQKALYIANGTLRLTGEVYIPTLNEGGRDYEIGERGALILDSPNVFVQQTANNSTDFNPTPALSYTAPVGVNNGTGSQSFTLFGKVQVNDGYFRVSESDNAVSLLFRSASPGVVEVNGGVFEANQFTFSNTATTDGNFGVIINGGVLRVNGENVLRGAQAAFHLPFEGNVFTMTGGFLEILEATGTGGLLINSLPSNINVTGGTVRLRTNDNNRFRINSSAPLFDLELTNNTASNNDNARFFVEDIDGIARRDLRVLNDLTIESGTIRNGDLGAFGPGATEDYGTVLDLVDEVNQIVVDLYVGGSLIIQQDAKLLSVQDGPDGGNAANDNDAHSTVFFNQTIGTDAIETFEWDNNPPLDMGALVIDRTTGNEVRYESQGTTGQIQLRVRGALEVLSGTLDQRNSTIQAFSSVRNFDRLGTWFTSGSFITSPGAQIRMLIDDIEVDTDGAIFGNVQINSNPNNPVEFVGDVVMERFEHQEGTIYIGENNLRIDDYWGLATNNYSPVQLQSAIETWIENAETSSFLNVEDQGIFRIGNGFDESQRALIITDGNASDGGLSLRVNGNTLAGEAGGGNGINNYDNLNQLTYPIGFTTDPGNPDVAGGGINTFYRPAQVKISDFHDDGYITIRPVSGELQTTDLGGGDLLQNYWRVTHSDFTDLPTVAYRFYYRNQIGTAGVDLPAGFTAGDDLATFVPGKVEDGGSFQRSYESNSAGQEDFGGVLSAPVDTDTRVIIFNGNNTGTTGDDLFDFDATNAPGFTLENANYTAGVANRFVGQPTIYYNRVGAGYSGNVATLPQWNDNTTWSTDPANRHSGGAATDFPGAGDVVILRTLDNGNLVNIGITNYSGDAGLDVQVAELQLYRENEAGTERRASRLYLDDDVNVDFNVVKGDATFQVFLTSTSTPFFNDTDFGEFVDSADDGAYFLFYGNSDGVLNLPGEITEFPNVRFEGNNDNNIDRFFQFSEDATVRDLVVDSRATFRVNRNVVVTDDLRIGQFRNGFMEFEGSNGAITLEVQDDFQIRNNNNNNQSQIFVNNSIAGLVHKIIVDGDIDFDNRFDNFDLFTDLTGGDNVALELGATDGTGVWTNADAEVPELYKIVMNGGNDVNTTFSINTEITLPDAISTFQPIEVLNGLLIVNDVNIDVSVANGSNLFIPNTNNSEASSGSGGLEIAQGTLRVEGDDTGIILDGLLAVSGGTLDMSTGAGNGNNFIEYGSSGNAEIVISSGVLDVGSQVRRSLTSTEGVLKYRQSGGNARFGINDVPNDTRGVFEVLNTGSEFEFTGGSFSIVRDNASASVASLRITPTTSNIAAGQPITVGTIDTPGGQNDFGIQSSAALGDLVIGSTNSPIAKIYSLPLTVDNLTIGAGGNGTFNANGFNLTINESIVNNGVFEAGGNTSNEQTTFFPAGSLTTINGNGTTTFYNFDKNGMGEVSVSKEVTVLNQTSIRNGILNTNDIGFFAEGDVLNDATHSSTLETDATQEVGFIFSGNQKQLLNRSGTGQSNFGMLRISNASGVEVNGIEQNFQVDEKLTLATGKFEIGGNLLIFPVNSYIENAVGGIGLNDFNVNNMIQTNSSIKDFGVRKFYNTAVDGLATFTYPVGLTAYTPVQFSRQTTNINGFITARPVADLPPIAEDAENTGGCSDGVEITDADNVLQYHWIIRSQGISGLEGDFEMYYDENDVSATNGYDETNYGAARLYNTETFWDKNNTVNSVEEGNNIVNFAFSNNDDATISGIYTAGVIQDGLGNPLCGAIPDEVPQFITITSGIDLYDQGPSYDGGVAPPASTAVDVTVRSGFTLQLNSNNIRMRKITIEENAVLEVNSGVINTNLGFIEGEGTLKITENGTSLAFPAGDYSEFFPTAACNTGGGLEFAGSGNYNFPADIPVLRNVIFSGSGTRRFPNNNILLVCEDLEIQNTVLLEVPDGNNNLTVLGNVIKSDGSSFDNGGGNSRLTMAGSTQQSIIGDFTGASALNQLRINNGSGLTVINTAQAGISANTDVEIEDELLLDNGIINTDVNNSLELLNGATVTGGSVSSHINGPFIRNLNAIGSTEAAFPVGDGGRYGRFAIRNTTRADNWTVTFFDSTPTDNANISTLDSNIPGANSVVSANQYWEATTTDPLGNTGRIRIDWDASSNVADGAASVPASLDELRVVSFKAGDMEWTDLGGGINATGSASQGTLISTSDATFSTTYFTFGAGDAANNSLPVEYTYFKAENEPYKVALKWETATEIENDYFEIQRSADGEVFETIGFVEGNGDSRVAIQYSFDDYSPLNGDNYYRLRQVDFDEDFEYSEVVKVSRAADSKLSVVPNPSTPSNVQLKLTGFNVMEDVQVVIYDVNGLVYYKAVHSAYSLQTETLPLRADMPSGVYIVKVAQGSLVKTVRLMIY